MLSRVGGRGIGREWAGGVKPESRMSKPSPRDMRSKFETQFSGTVRAAPPPPLGDKSRLRLRRPRRMRSGGVCQETSAEPLYSSLA